MIKDDGVQTAIDSFPVEFGLYNFPGKTFRIAKEYCYNNGECVQLVTEVLTREGQWLHFARGTVNELRMQIVRMKG